MQEKSVSRSELMASFEALQGQFDQQTSDIRSKEAAFDQLRRDFASQLNLRSKELSRLIGSGNPLQPLANGLADQLAATFDGWEKQVANRAKGTRFREGFGDSLLVFIYGKVKSGKSSLGNYMAWGHSEPSAELKAQALPPSYFSEERTAVVSGDQEKEAETNRQFRVGATEATSSIQGFRLPGLTWVDSPGLHSVNGSNGDLAKEYVEHADLILYTMSSQAPGRASDMKEITELLDNGKKIMVLLTGSDTPDEDEDADGNLISTVIMKSESDRREQVAYVRNELEQLHASSGVLAEVLPVSTRFAELNPTPEGEAANGMGRLMHELQSICTSQALAIKLEAPMNNLRRSIRTTAGDLAGVRELIDGFASGVSAQDGTLQRLLANLGVKGASQMRGYINQLFAENRFDDLEGALRRKAGEIIGELAEEAFEKIGEQQQKTFRDAFDSSRLGAIPEYREIVEEREYFVGTRKGSKKTLGAIGALVGGGIGLFFGGPAGAALGASLGSMAGMGGSSARAEYGRHDVVVGDNREDQRQSAMANYAGTLPGALSEYVNARYNPLRSAMQEYCKVLDGDVTALMGSLEKLSQVDR